MKSKIKKSGQRADRPEAILSLMARNLGSNRTEQEILDDLVSGFVALRDTGKQVGRAEFSRLLAGFQELAQQNNIKAEKFYAALLQRVLADPEREEGLRGKTRQATKERILEAALDLFSEKGFHLTTVDEIADRAGVGKGTLYRYFENKGSLFNELVKSRLEDLERSAQAVLDSQDDVLTMITKYVRIYFEFFDRNKQLYRLILQERLELADQVQELYIKKVMRRIPRLKRKIHEASQKGILKEVDFHTVFYGVMGFIHGVIQKWLDRDCTYPLMNELPTVMEVLFYGFVKSKSE